MLGFKKIDTLLLRSFIGPFIVTFGIAIFVLTMVMLWTQIDKIIGKNVSIWIILEMILYLSLAMVTQALPISVLVSSVLVFGNLSEQYELSSMKSAGVSLMRIMRAPLLFSVVIAIISFLFANFFIPAANLKFETRLKDIRYQKPTLSLDKGVYNDDFAGFTIWIGDKGEDGTTIKDVVIYDHNESHTVRMNVIHAKSGKMFSTPDKKQFIMQLFDGHHYQEMKNEKNTFKPFLKTKFKEWRKVFDLSQFELDLTDEDVHKNHYRMLSVRQLDEAIDRLQVDIDENRNKLVGDYIVDTAKQENKALNRVGSQIEKYARSTNVSKSKLSKPRLNKRLEFDSVRAENATEFLDLFTDKGKKEIVLRSQSHLQDIVHRAAGYQSTIASTFLLREKHIFEKHTKFALALSCIIFLFIGAPMGAIIRKGGFGYPMLITILFFVGYIMLMTGSREMMKAGGAEALRASWAADLLFLPVGILLTVKAMNDSKFVNIDDTFRRVRQWIARIRSR